MTDIAYRSMVMEEFTPLVGKTFVADCEPRPVQLVLVSASPMKQGAPEFRPPFLLIFRSDPMAALIDGGYTMRCGDWGPDAIQIQPVSPPPGKEAGNYYQAIFN